MVENNEEFYCLTEDCVFLQTADPEAVETDTGSVLTPLLAKRNAEGGYAYRELTKTTGFILRLLLQQLDIPLLRQVLLWKYPGQLESEEQADNLIQAVIALYREGGFIRSMEQDEIERLKTTPLDPIEPLVLRDKPYFNKLTLSATINQIGSPIIKFPWPPIR